MASHGVPQGFVTSGIQLPGHPRGCCGETLSGLHSCLHGSALQGDNSPKGSVCSCFRFSPGLSATVMLQDRLETLVLLWHEKQGPRGQSEEKLVFHMSSPLRVIAVFILQAEMQEHDRN